MQKYKISFTTTNRYEHTVKAKSLDEAKDIVLNKYRSEGAESFDFYDREEPEGFSYEEVL